MDNKDLIVELMEHYQTSSDDVDIRKTRKNGWDDVLKAYFNHFPSNWPYQSRVADPLIRTTIIEKTARQFNSKLRGRVIARKGETAISSRLMNALLDFQWDTAEEGGSMLEKWALMDMQTRMFGASFGLCYWRTQVENGDLVFEGNDFKVLDNRDVFVDYTATHVKNANWVQVREFVTIDDLQERNEISPEPVYTDIDELEKLMADDSAPGDARDTLYTSLVKEHRALEDRVGRDKSFPVVELVTEYRRDRWITFAPRYKIVIRDVENPSKDKKIPVVQLRYYNNGDDVYGDSEVEPVLPIQRAINAFLSGYIDQMNLSMRPPVKVSNAKEVQMGTIVYGPNALWLTGSSPNNVVEHQFSPTTSANFQSVMNSFKSAFNTAMGEFSLGVSNVDPFGGDKTATEVRALQSQSLSRDQYNQLYLAEALKDQMGFWIANNQQYIFEDSSKAYHLFRVAGRDIMQDLMEQGLADTVMDTQILSEIANMVQENGGQLDEATVEAISKEAEIPKYPVILNPNADPEKQEIRGKVYRPENQDYADVYLVPEDVEGAYEYIPDVVSMTIGAQEQLKQGRQQALGFVLNPQIDQKLQLEGQRTKIKELIVQVLESEGIKDADKYFEEIPQNEQNPTGQGIEGLGGGVGPGAQQGLGDPANVGTELAEQSLPGPGGGSGPGDLLSQIQ